MKLRLSKKRTGSILALLATFGLAFSVWLGLPSGRDVYAWGQDLVMKVLLPVISRNGSQSSCFQPLLLSEVLYNPSEAEPDYEWIELYNAGVRPVNLSGYLLGDAAQPGDPEGMYVFSTDHFVSPGETVVLANKASAFYSRYEFEPDYELEESVASVPNLSSWPVWSSGHIELSNSGDELVLRSSSDCVMDAVSWGSSNYAFDPAGKNAPEGFSLERYPPGVDTGTAADWRFQRLPSPGTVDHTEPTRTPTASQEGTEVTPETKTPTATALQEETEVSPATQTPTKTTIPPPLLIINEIHADPHPVFGSANGDLVVSSIEDQFVEIVNHSGRQVDLSGWTISDQQAIRHTFPAGSYLQHGCAVVVFGGGSPVGSFGGSLVQTASSGALNLSPSGDRLTLLSPDSLSYAYSYGEEGADDQSLTRSPDIIGDDPLIKHNQAPGSGEALYSPGTRLDGKPFSGCSR